MMFFIITVVIQSNRESFSVFSVCGAAPLEPSDMSISRKKGFVFDTQYQARTSVDR